MCVYAHPHSRHLLKDQLITVTKTYRFFSTHHLFQPKFILCVHSCMVFARITWSTSTIVLWQDTCKAQALVCNIKL